MKQLIERLFGECPGGEPEYLDASDWLYEATDAEREILYLRFSARFDQFRQEIQLEPGPAHQDTDEHASTIRSWYPEAIQAACWLRDDKLLCLGLEHHD